jgi:uncharacterized membrane protein YkoI
MRLTRPRAIGPVWAALAVAAVAPALAFTGEELAGQAKVSIVQARAIALKAHPGRIVTEELEQEDGGSGLRYTFGVESGKATQEVGVDAKTGVVLENTPD